MARRGKHVRPKRLPGESRRDAAVRRAGERARTDAALAGLVAGTFTDEQLAKFRRIENATDEEMSAILERARQAPGPRIEFKR